MLPPKNTEGFSRPQKAQDALRDKLLQQALPTAQEGYIMPEDYLPRSRKRILEATAGSQPTRVIQWSSWLKVAAVGALVLSATVVMWPDETSASVSLADVSADELYQYVDAHLDQVSIDELIEYQLVDESSMVDLNAAEEQDVEAYLLEHADQLDLEILEDYL